MENASTDAINCTLDCIKPILINVGGKAGTLINRTENNNVDGGISVTFLPCCWYFLILLGLLIIAINSLVIFAYRTHHQVLQRKNFTLLLFNQACADLQAGLLYVPAYIVDAYVNTGISSYIVCFIFFNGLFGRAILALNCYISVTKPLEYATIMTRAKFKYLLSGTWSTSSILSLLPLCWIADTPQRKKIHRRNFRIFLWIVIAFMLFVILALYLLTFYRARQYIRKKLAVIRRQSKGCTKRLSSLSNSYSRKEHRLIIQFAISTCIFIFTYLPLLYINFIGPFFQRPDLNPNWLLTMSLYMFLLNPIVSPLISLCFNKDFRAPIMDKFRSSCIKNKKKESFNCELNEISR